MYIKNNIELNEKLIAFRRDIHKHAEVKWTEFRTTSIIADELRSLGYELFFGLDTTTSKGTISRPDEASINSHIKRSLAQNASEENISKMNNFTGVIACFDTKKSGPTIAFRFDIDALPNHECENDSHIPYKEGFRSINDFCVHSCGHDGHTAIGIGVAKVLMENKDLLTGKFKLIFQPSEEGGGGAYGIVDKGWVDDVDYLFALHLCLSNNGLVLKSGEIGTGCKDFLANRRFNVTFEGQAAHPCGDPQNGKNAILAACNATLNIHAIPPHSEGLFRVNVGIINGGVSKNTVAPNSYLELEVRGENNDIAEYGENKVRNILEGAAKMYDLKCDIDNIGNTPSGYSDPSCMDIIKRAASKVAWFKDIYEYAQVGGSDDVTEMLNRVHSKNGKGTYIGVGADIKGGVHTNNFDFDENIMLPTVELLINAVFISIKGV